MTTETLTPDNYTRRMTELRAMGAVIFRCSVGKRLCDWDVSYYIPTPLEKQEEMFESPAPTQRKVAAAGLTVSAARSV